jgi:hypothetical protein
VPLPHQKAFGGNGIQTDNDKDESAVTLVSVGSFRAEIGADLSGFAENGYDDIETSVAPRRTQIAAGRRSGVLYAMATLMRS